MNTNTLKKGVFAIITSIIISVLGLFITIGGLLSAKIGIIGLGVLTGALMKLLFVAGIIMVVYSFIESPPQSKYKVDTQNSSWGAGKQYCTNCGVENLVSSSFCYRCGRQLKPTAA